MKSTLPTALFLLLLPLALFSQTSYTLSSPDGLLRLEIETTPRISWQLFRNNLALTDAAPITMSVDGIGVLGQMPTVLKTETNTVIGTVKPVVHQKSAHISDVYNELTINCKGDWGLAFRAYNEGVAYRFFTNLKGNIQVNDETYAFRPLRCVSYFYPQEDGFYSHNERQYLRLKPDQINETKLASLPALVELEGNVKILLTETDLQDYPGLWLSGMNGKNGNLRGVFPRYPKYAVEMSNRDMQPTDRETFLAKNVKGTRSFPWRLFLVSVKDVDLLNNQMPFLLAEPNRIADPSWIKPGKVAWDWWNNLNLYGVDFRAGINTATYKYFIDFAAENGLQYIILDEGWCETAHFDQIAPELNMDELAAYGKQKGVGIILWVTWLTIDRHFDDLLPNLKKWDIKGLKIDFMQRDDQEMVQYYWRLSEKCAANQLLVDFHGACKPSGLHRTWPNVLSFEGVYGLENSKWDVTKKIDPEHNVTLPFIRMVAGPMDYTPGAMLNSQISDWSPSWNRPASLGTRCHELAKYVVFESPLQMLSDSPSNYKKEPESLQFLSKVPAVWEKTVALDAVAGDFVAIARQSADGLWYLGVMTDWTPRTLQLDTRFLPAGDYEIEWFEDGINADHFAQDYRRRTGHIKSGDPIAAKMAPGGGFVAVLRKLGN